MTLPKLKEMLKKVFSTQEKTDEYEEGLMQLLSMIEETEEYRRKVDDMTRWKK